MLLQVVDVRLANSGREMVGQQRLWEELHLAENELTNAATHFVDALVLNRTLRTLDLRATTLRVAELRPALRINRSVRVLL